MCGRVARWVGEAATAHLTAPCKHPTQILAFRAIPATTAAGPSAATAAAAMAAPPAAPAAEPVFPAVLWL